MMQNLRLAVGCVTLAALASASPAAAQDTVKVGVVLPMSGTFASTGRQVSQGAELYMKEHGDVAGGKKIQLIVKDDTGRPDMTKRIAQQLVVSDKVDILAGFGLTPLALAGAPIATEAKKLMVVMAAGTTIVTEKSPYIVRSFFTLPQASIPMGEWAAKNGIKTADVLVSNYGPGLDAARAFTEKFTQLGGKVPSQLRVPMENPDFAPFLQKVVDDHPDAVFVFVPAGIGASLMKQAAARGLQKAGIKLIGTGDVPDDDILADMGDASVGFITAYWYSAAHKSPENEKFVADFEKNYHRRPGYMAVTGYDGMHLIYAALDKTKGNTDGDALIAAAKGLSWESPRGPMKIDPETREPIQNIYIRKVEKVKGELYNVEFATFPMVKAPHHDEK